ncbi:cell wall-binding repeat-containing protein [Peptostreptococcus faecalis]|uniref:cell wall-binding repeat-containing protein n=1 Tax=Peptostreptococcus faecalis TaxID=2045015 RepID=UPI000C79B033|nr:cell wall-binding repeat-containing protein [Peptostreptococcus faecalis]
MKKITFLCLAAVITMSFTLSVNAEDNSSELNVSRIEGKDRYETSVNIAKNIKKDTSEVKYIVVASGEQFPDALSAGFLASEFSSPLLLVKKNSVPSSVLDYVFESKFPNAYIVGGEKSISKNTEKNISTYTTMNERIAGKDRYQTSELASVPISKLNWSQVGGDTAAVYNGKNFPDALSATPYMHQYNIVNTTKLPLFAVDGTKSSEGNLVVFGGEKSIPKYKEEYRLAGDDRYKTSVEIAKAYKTKLNKDIETVVIANGDDYPDALCAGPLASSKNGAVLLTKSNKLNSDTKEYLKSNKNIKNIIIVGGENSISKSVENELKEIKGITEKKEVIPFMRLLNIELNENIKGKYIIEELTETRDIVEKYYKNETISWGLNYKPAYEKDKTSGYIAGLTVFEVDSNSSVTDNKIIEDEHNIMKDGGVGVKSEYLLKSENGKRYVIILTVPTEVPVVGEFRKEYINLIEKLGNEIKIAPGIDNITTINKNDKLIEIYKK